LLLQRIIDGEFNLGRYFKYFANPTPKCLTNSFIRISRKRFLQEVMAVHQLLGDVE
jgi:hypothetical protein